MMKLVGVLICLASIAGGIVLWIYLLMNGAAIIIHGMAIDSISRTAWGVIYIFFANISGVSVTLFGTMLGLIILHTERN